MYTVSVQWRTKNTKKEPIIYEFDNYGSALDKYTESVGKIASYIAMLSGINDMCIELKEDSKTLWEFTADATRHDRG